MSPKYSESQIKRTERRNLQAEGAGRESIRYQPFCADRLAFVLGLDPGQKILEVFAGTGHFALTASQAVGSSGRITAIDVSEKMLDRLTDKIRKFSIENIDVHSMDAAPLDFRRDYFHHVVCVLGLEECPEAIAALREWRRVLVSDGQLMLSVFDTSAFEPAAGLLRRQIESMGVTIPEPAKPFCTDAGLLRHWVESAGYSKVTVTPERLGYHLPDPESWWEVVLYGPLRRWLEPLSAAQTEELRALHLGSLVAQKTSDGYWLDASFHLVRAIKPPAG